MLSILKNHPFAVEAFFESSLILTFAVPKEELKKLIPSCLKLDTLNDKYAFLAVALVQTTGLRPKGFPAFLGNDFFLIGYRIFVQYSNQAGRRRRGLYILKSETDKKKMELLGNIFTHYNYRTTDIKQKSFNNQTEISSIRSNFKITIDTSTEHVPLPPDSPFKDWKEARKFAGPLPFTFTYLAKSESVLIIEGVRDNWVPKPVKVIDYNFPFLASLDIAEANLANAFIITKTPYYWKKGIIEKCNL